MYIYIYISLQKVTFFLRARPIILISGVVRQAGGEAALFTKEIPLMNTDAQSAGPPELERQDQEGSVAAARLTAVKK
jgi:hypothetical protein